MLRRLRRGFAAVTCAVVVVAGCSGASDDTASPEPDSDPIPTQPAPTPTTIDVTKIPDEITLGYVDAVLKVIDHLHGEAARLVHANKRVDDRVIDTLAAIYAKTEGEAEAANLTRALTEGLDQYFAELPGDPVTEVKSVLDSSGRCIVVAASTNLSPFFQKPQTPLSGAVIQLGLKGADTDPDRLNPSPWLIYFAGVPSPGQEVNQACDRVR